ncbi:MAG: hypothetical protein A2W93_09120 [Bacteroidetes bacterium GWF2_43_63]|nr:MAG: hypothetical protein A2W94_05500 [Bacteroidetes bacterium GWE2_42_42]OFY54457.1 MAG: hypothetical protein A2W93_09120 [Bacteroidetes bacterium GWF2_43_63]HBG70405.1 hypothetical protein [Bacteroidales bacterium]HCB63478.1 hypothetical protein [Bacteroidales bacterium]
MEQIQWLENELKLFARKYYMNIFWQRLALFVAAIFLILVVFSLAEYSFWFETGTRFFLFWGLIILVFASFSALLLQPLFLLFGIKKQLSRQEFALVIGKHFPDVNDRILNILELSEGKYSTASVDLIVASIRQKLGEVKFFHFFEAIDRRRTFRRIPLIIVPFLFLLIMGFTMPDVLLNPLERLSHYNTEYVKPAPFDFVIQNENMEVAQNSDFTVLMQLEGSEIPEEVFLEDGDRRFRMNPVDRNVFQYTFKSVKKDQNFHFYADGYKSADYTVSVFKMPAIVSYSLHISYPSYTGKQNEVINNINSLSVPRGTIIRFHVLTRDADDLKVFDENNRIKVLRDERNFVFERLFDNNVILKAVSFRNNVKAADSLEFSFAVVPDEFPTISVKEEVDSTMFMLRYFSGKISDDYGLSKLKFDYKFYAAEGGILDSSFNIPISSEYNLQEFYNAFDFSVFDLRPGDRIEYFFTVFDNDSYAGPKSSKSQVFTFRMPGKEEMEKLISEKSEQVSGGLENMFEEAAKLQKELDEFIKKNSQKKKLDWEDQEKLRELLDREKQMEENLNKAGEQNAERLRMSEQLNEFNEQVYEKQRMIDELLNQIMDDEFREMLEKLTEMLEKNNSNISPHLEELNEKNDEILKNMEQTIELLKRSKVEEDILSLTNDLKESGKEQEDLSKSEESAQDKMKNQEELNKMFDELQQKADSMIKQNSELEEPFPMDSLSKKLDAIDSTMKAASDQLKSGKQNKASKSQQEAAEQMQDLAEEMEQMMEEASEEQNEEDMGLVREILENLITISFQQEDLMRNVAVTRIADPKYFENLRKQKRIEEGLSIINDSLSALGRRNPMINSFITDELTKISQARKNALENLNSRYVAPATREQQNVMMGVNNLALLLSDALKQMQQQANQQKQGQGSSSQCKKPGNKPGNKPGKGQGEKPSAKTLRQLQEQLNQQMESLKKQMESGQKPGPGQPGMSEQLAKMAAQQEAIRKAMQQYQQQLNSEGGNGSALNKVINDMEKTEEDLVNKRLNTETMDRQKQIETRLLESEKADMEREKDPKRQSEEAKIFNNGNPMTFFKYNSLKRNSSEILKTVPPNLNPYYKQKVNEYLYKTKAE